MEKEQISRLVERFGKDVTCDKDLLRTRFINSLARQELCKLGQEALRPIISHLRANPPSEPVVAQAFCNLFYCLEEKVDPCATATKSLIDLRGWLEWAEKFADAE